MFVQQEKIKDMREQDKEYMKLTKQRKASYDTTTQGHRQDGTALGVLRKGICIYFFSSKCQPLGTCARMFNRK